MGIKGAGPILFAMYPVLAGFSWGRYFFNTVFIVTVLSLILQGPSMGIVARLLGLTETEEEKPETFGLEIPEEMGMMRDHIVTEEDLSHGRTLRELRLPHGIRGEFDDS